MNPWVFDNNYYFELLRKEPRYLRTNSDKALLSDSEYAPIIESFAKDQELFFSEFEKAYLKISEFGVKDELKIEEGAI